MSIITLTGDRQAGKSHAALSALLINALCGQRCAYVGYTLEYARHMLNNASDLLPQESIAKITLAHGDMAIRLVNGGEVIFRSHRQIARLPHVDSCVLDDWPTTESVPIGLLSVGHIYVCPNADEAL